MAEEMTAANATHELECSHVCNWTKYYRMPCHVLKTMPDGRLKVRVFGDRHWLHSQDKSRIRYVDAHRVTPRQGGSMNQVRNVTAHAIDGELGDMNLCVSAFGPYSPGGAQNHYHIGEAVEVSLVAAEWFGKGPPPGVVRWLAEIRFQDGNPTDHGVNGVTLEALLAVCFDRLEHFQKGPYANAYNAEALHHIERAIEALKDRTRERDANAC